MTRPFLDELAWRELLSQHTEGAAEALGSASTSGYCGFDASGASLHIGHLVPVMGLTHLQRAGHRPVALVGGGTGMIGDPSGKSAERNLLTAEQVAEHSAGLQGQLERFLDFSGPHAAQLRNNANWILSLHLVDFLRDTGKFFSVNTMLAKDSVKSRLETGISYTEFSYMLLQAYDFLELNRRDGVTLQLGGSDQWGNITAGTELLRKAAGVEAHGITLPLVTNADGSKFGKTAAGTSVWLDPARTSPYKFYQHWIHTDDRDAGRYLRMFTLLEREAIEQLEAALAEHPERREAQGALAADVTTRVHGQPATDAARDASRVLFDRKADPRSLSEPVLAMLWDEVPQAHALPGEGDTISIIDVLVDSGLVKSKGDGRRQLQQGAVTVNGRKLSADEATVPLGDALSGGFFLVRKGARDVALARVATSDTPATEH
ncbi:MAG: tyrosine--tRNA ligase [Gemmatimonadota bacterium]